MTPEHFRMQLILYRSLVQGWDSPLTCIIIPCPLSHASYKLPRRRPYSPMPLNSTSLPHFEHYVWKVRSPPLFSHSPATPSAPFLSSKHTRWTLLPFPVPLPPPQIHTHSYLHTPSAICLLPADHTLHCHVHQPLLRPLDIPLPLENALRVQPPVG